MQERFIAYKKEGKFDKSQGFVHESAFVNKTDEEAIRLFAKANFEAVIVDRNQVDLINSTLTLDELKNKLIVDRKTYLNSTDWYIAREIDVPGSYPDFVRAKRIKARIEQGQITNANNLQALSIYNIIF